jgi:hypothetical protein
MLLFRTLNIIILIIILSVIAVFTKVHKKDSKIWYEFEYQTDYRNPSKTQQRSSDAIKLYKEYKDSIYIDRYFNASFALNIPLFTLTMPVPGRSVFPLSPGNAFNIGLYSHFLSNK